MKKTLLWLLVAAFLFGVFFGGCGKKPEPVVVPVVEEIEEEEEIEDLTVRVQNVKPVAVVINNHRAAWPQSGLQQASLVYEFLVEGGTTRYLAVFDRHFEENFLVGPVRSLRPYFGEQAREYGGVIAHSGYSVSTQEMIKGMGLKQITSAEYLWRDSSRNAPHNLYTDISKLFKARGASDITELEFEPVELPGGYEEESNPVITYSASYKVSYKYDAENGEYLRFINGGPLTDRESGKQYSASRVIVRTAKHTNVPGPDALVDIDLSGSGDGFLYEAGRKYEIRWEKKDGKTGYYYKDGTRVETGWGNTWIQVVRSL
ncbi:MAG: DUF3048 domain-containing protein [Clostridiales bacterium]|nr:DUF3048 domain-containing protein [Clostridiales bacterium]